jgi:hypothetical protein
MEAGSRGRGLLGRARPESAGADPKREHETVLRQRTKKPGAVSRPGAIPQFLFPEYPELAIRVKRGLQQTLAFYSFR